MKPTTVLVVLALLVGGCGTDGIKATKAETHDVVEPGPRVEKTPSTRAESSVRQEARYVNRRGLDLDVPRDRLGPGGAALWVDAGDGWTLHGKHEGRPAAVTFNAPADGRYAFYVGAVGQAGDAGSGPDAGTKPDYLYWVDTAPPAVEVLGPNGNEVFAERSPTQVSWMCEDPNLEERPISLWVSTDGGLNWIEEEKGLPNTGRYYWTTPTSSSETCRIKIVARDRAGNCGEDASDKAFAIDALAPDVRLIGPTSSTSIPVDVAYRANDLGGSGLRRVTLFVTRDGGRSWDQVGEDADLASPYALTTLDGALGLWIVAEDGVGNASPMPAPGLSPMMSLAVDTTPPQVTLLSPKAGTYQGGQRLEVQWSARDNLDLPVECATLYFSDDDGVNWKLVGDRIANSGAHSWLVPSASAKKARVKLSVRDVLGNVREVASEPFAIDNNVPEAFILGPARSRDNVVALQYDIRGRGSAPIESVVLWWRTKGGVEWSRYGEDPDGATPMSFLKNDGEYDLYMTCATRVGAQSDIRQKPPAPLTAPHLTLAIDATPPGLTLRSFDAGGSVRAGEVRDIAWDFNEAHPRPDGLKIEHSSDGANWDSIAVAVNPQDQKYSWAVPRLTGRVHYIRLTCVDGFDNSTTVMTSRPFYVDLHPPIVRVNKLPPERVRVRRVPVNVEGGDDVSGIDHIEAWGRIKGQSAGYERRASMASSAGDLAIELPTDGQWEIAIVAFDRVNQPSRDLYAKTEPDFTITVDTVPPRVELTRLTAPNGKPVYVNDLYELLWKAEDQMTPADGLRARVEYSADGGLTWVIAAENVRGDKFPADGFLQPGQKYRVRVNVMDEVGNAGHDESTDFDVDTLPAMAMRLSGIEAGATLIAGASADLSWVAVHGTVRGATVRISRDGGVTWDPVASAAGDKYRLTLPATPGLYSVNVAAVDRFGKEILSNTISFNVDHPPVRAIAAELVKSPGHGESFEPGEEVRAKWSIGDVGEPYVELLVEVQTPGRNWEAAQRLSPTDRIYTYVLPEALGLYQIRVRGRDGLGRTTLSNALSVPVPDPARAMVDMAISPTKATYDAGSRVCVVWSPAKAGVGDAWLEISSDNVEWKADRKAEPGSFFYMLPEKIGKYWLRLGYTDKGGKTWQTPAVAVAVSTPTAPMIGFAIDAENREVVPPGTAVSMKWSGDTGRLRKLWIQIGTDDGWRDVREVAPLDLGAQFAAPSSGGSYRVRLRWEDAVGRPGFTSREARMRVAGELRSIVGKMLTVNAPAGGVGRVEVKPEGFGVEADSVRVEIREDKGTDPVEAPAARLRDGVVTFGAPALAGKYWVRVYGGERQTRGRTGELPMTVVTPGAGEIAPSVKLETMRGGQVYLGGSSQIVVVKVAGPVEREDVALDFTEDSGRSWRRLAEEQLVRIGSGINVKLPRVTAGTCRLRAAWAMRPEVCDASAADFGIDATPPGARIRPMATEQRSAPVKVEAELRPSLTPIDRVKLHYSINGGKSWMFAETFKAGEAISFSPPAGGVYDLYVQAISAVELTNGEPKSGTPAHATFTFRPDGAEAGALSVRLARAVPSVLKGGARCDIEWVGFNAEEAKVDVDLYVDGERVAAIAEGQPGSGSCTWVVPARDIPNCEIRVRINRGTAEAWDRSAGFSVDVTAPDIEGIDVNDE